MTVSMSLRWALRWASMKQQWFIVLPVQQSHGCIVAPIQKGCITLHKRYVLGRSSLNEVNDGNSDDSDGPMATEMRHSWCWQFLRVPRNMSKFCSTRYLPYNQLRRLPSDGCNQAPIGEQDAIMITLPLNASIDQERAISKVVDDIWNNTATFHGETHQWRALRRRSTKRSYGKPNEAHRWMRSSLPAMRASESDERSPL